jgi:membrane-associated phospholipid phosphatase
LLAYHTLIPQMIVAVVALSAAARFASLRVTLLAALLSGAATILISGLVPALGALVDPASQRHLPESVAWMHKERILALRDGTLRAVDLSVLTGIVSFPSYHAALSLIFIWSFRQVRLIAAAGTVWGIATILSTPTIGGHYAVDVLAGLALGAASLWAALRLAKAQAAVRDEPARMGPPARLQPRRAL